MTDDNNWWSALYDDVLADVLLERADPEETARTLDFLTEVLELRTGDVVFDQCAGIGSLGVPLAQRGFRVIGVEQAPHYAARANEAAHALGAVCHVVTGDAFEFVPEARCRGAFNWWTSFGYEAKDAANRRMLERAFDALDRGARFALDTMNAPGILRGFREHVELMRHTPQGEILLVRKSRLDLRTAMLHKVWSFELPDGRLVERPSTVRLYAPHELLRLFTEAGFTEVRFFGGITAEPLGMDSPRCICVGQKP